MSAETPFVFEPHAGAEPMILVEEIAGRVLNDYSGAIETLLLAASETRDMDARDALTGAARRLRARARVHRVLKAPPAGGIVDLGDHLERLCAALSAAELREQGVRLLLSCEPAPLPSEQSWRLGLIVCELISVAARHGLHGSGGSILVDVRNREQEIHCEVVDDGPAAFGVPPERVRRVVEGLAEALDGRVAWRFSPRGSSVLVAIPAPFASRTVPCGEAAGAGKAWAGAA